MLHIPDLTKVPEYIPEHPFQFELDSFQKHAIYAISKDENVLVTAKTGSGKTLVGEYQIYHSLKKGKRVFYTTPIKSLSNQKFYDLKKQFKDSVVGIMTGDIKFCPHADIVVMTTEILRNLLFKTGTQTEHIGVTAELSLQNVDSIIFDEVHYINDPDRGKVWEECLTIVPKNINLVLLSATIEKPSDFANWLSEIKEKNIHLLSTEYRIVPLLHKTPEGDIILDSKDNFNSAKYREWYSAYFKREDDYEKHKRAVRNRQEGEDVIHLKSKNTSFLDRMNKLIPIIDLPAIFFVFSRASCMAYAKKVNTCLTTSSEMADIRHITDFHLHRYPELQKMTSYHELYSLLEKGIAYHHSGMLPILKEIIEVLFSKGLIKLLFATETFAVGLNMPTKTVVFTSYRKFDDKTEGFRMLTPSEYTQMAGRAGRRGKDDIGHVIYLPIREPEPLSEVQSMMIGKKSSVSSQMDFHYDYVLSTVLKGKEIIENTFWYRQHQRNIETLKKEIETKESEIPILSDEVLADCEIRYTLENTNAVNAERKKIQAKIEQWKNSHISPVWNTHYSKYKARRLLESKINIMKNDLIRMIEDYDAIIDERKESLTNMGFMEDGTLTQKGILASEIHEGDPLIMSELFIQKTIHDKSPFEIVASLSSFLEEPKTDETFPDLEITLKLKEIIRKLSSHERVKSEWKVTSYWYDVVIEWLIGDDFVCEKFGIDQGNFVKAMLKLSNIVEEWVNLARLMQDVDMIEKLIDIRNSIVKGFITHDSLYLRI